MRAIEAVKAHYKSLGTLHIEVPEWGTDGVPLRVFYTPVTIEERDKLALKSGSDLDIDILMLKAKDEQGQPLFSKEDKPALRLAAVSGVISRVAFKLTAVPTIEDAEKN